MVFSVRGETKAFSGISFTGFSIGEIRGNHDGIKPARGKRTGGVQLGQLGGGVIIPFVERHQILQVIITDLRALIMHIAKAVTLAAVELDIPERFMLIFDDAQLAFQHVGIKVPFAQCHTGKGTLKCS